jgi:hypothetical protein
MHTLPYQVPEAFRSDRLLGWRFSENDRLFHSLRALPDDFQRDGFHTQSDLIAAWIELAQSAFAGEMRESAIPCWDGHYEQFGMLMLQIALSSDKRGQDGIGDAELIDVIMPERDFGEAGFWMTSGSADRTWYRAWFAMIGHPDFGYIEAQMGQESMTYQFRKFALRYAAELLIETKVI